MTSEIQFKKHNLIIGGNFDTNPFQRGRTFANADALHIADRFVFGRGPNAVATFSSNVELDAPPIAEANIFSQNSLRLLVGTPDAAPAADTTYTLHHRIEGFNWAQVAQKPTVLSFWLRSSVIGTFPISIWSGTGVSILSVVKSFEVTTIEWEYHVITFPASPVGDPTTWNYTNGAGVVINFSLGAGTDSNAAALGVWENGGHYSFPGLTQPAATAGATYQLQLIQFTSGTVSQSFEIRSFAEELALCQRYYEKSFNVDVEPAQNLGNNTGEVRIHQTRGSVLLTNTTTIDFKVPKRKGANTFVTFNPEAANDQIRNLIQINDCTGTIINANQENGFALNFTTSAGSAVGDTNTFHWTCESEL